MPAFEDDWESKLNAEVAPALEALEADLQVVADTAAGRSVEDVTHDLMDVYSKHGVDVVEEEVRAQAAEFVDG